jgi:hypothetical protein
VAISLGDGRTIEARGSEYGVNEFPAAGRFNYAGVIPGMGATAEPGGAVTPAADETEDYDQIDVPTGPPDTDADGLSDQFERVLGSDPTQKDSDRDGRDDALEVLSAHTDPTHADGAVIDAASRLPPGGDADHDTLSNRFELRHHLNPRLADSDMDGLSDTTELSLGFDPTAVDTDHDGFTDYLEAKYEMPDPDSESGLGAVGTDAALSDDV